MAEKKLKRAFGLIRISTSEQDMQSQKDKLQQIAKEKGYLIVDDREGHDFFSEQISGYDEPDEDRESIVHLKEQIAIRRPDAIFCLELSRLTRRATKVSGYIRDLSITPHIPMYFADYDIWTFVYDKKKGKYVHNDDGINTLYGAALSVEMERRRIRERTMRGRDAKAEKGFYVGHLADGYIWKYDDNHKDKVIDVDEQRKDIIKEIFDLYVNKDYSVAEIRDYLNEKKYPTNNKYRYEHPELFKGYKEEFRDRSGNVYSRKDVIWSDGMVSGVLKNEWYIGVRKYHKKEYSIKPIIDKKVWDECQEKLKQKRTNISTAKHPYLLSNLLFCGVCGKKLYGHNDGGYGDMYYCSSYEYGKKNKCGLRWIRRQNIEAIVMNIVKRRVYSDVAWGDQTPFSNFFSVDKKQIKNINDKIRSCNSSIARYNGYIDESNEKIYKMTADKYRKKDEDDIVILERLIDDEKTRIKGWEQDKLDCRAQINGYKREIKMLQSVEDKLIEVRNLEDYTKAKALLQSVIKRITLYNSDKTSTVIVIEYIHGKKDIAIYNPIKMKKKFIVLSMEEWGISKHLQYDTETKKIVFKGCYLACCDSSITLFDEEEPEETQMEKEIRETEGRVRLGIWDTPENKERFVLEMMELGVSKDEAIRQYDEAVEQKLIWRNITDAIDFYEAQGGVVFKDEVSVLDYIERKKNMRFCVFSYEDLLPMSERGERIKNYHKEYIKRYYTGRNPSEPFIIKDVNYKQICKERKHLYNRKYKILHNKHLTQTQKDEQIFRIMEKLEAYKHQINYNSASIKGVNHIAKYGKHNVNNNDPK